jgi:UDPglucose 6-dehydrogenase
VALGIGLDPRIGREFLNAGIGFGGYCFPKDLRAFMYLARENEVDCGLLEEVEKVNLRRAEVFLKNVRQAVRFSCLGSYETNLNARRCEGPTGLPVRH